MANTIQVKRGTGTSLLAAGEPGYNTARDELFVGTGAVNVFIGPGSSRPACRVATAAALPANTRTGNVLTASANGALNGTGIDSVTTLAANDRVLVKNEATGANNGLYFLSALGDAGTPWTLTRVYDANSSSQMEPGLLASVVEGTANGGKLFMLTTAGAITLNTTSLTFADKTGSGTSGTVTSITAGTGLTGGVITGSGTVAADFGSGAGKITEGNDSRLSDARTPVGTALTSAQVWVGSAGNVAAAVAISGDVTITNAGAVTVTQARGLRETSGPTTLTMGAIADGQMLVRSGSTIVGATAGSGTVTTVSVVTANGVSGSVANATTTPAITLTLGAIVPTSVNGLTVTTTTGTLTLVNGSTLVTAGANSLTLTTTGASNVTFPTTGTLSTLAGSEALTNKSVNGLTITASTGTLTVANGKTASFSNTLTVTGTDGSTLNIGAGGTLGSAAYVALDTDNTLAADSDTRVPSQKAIKAYVANAVAGLLDLKGDTDASGNPNYPAASKGDAYYVTVAGKVGGASGKSVDVGDVYVAKADNAGGTEASVGTSWFVLEHNLLGALLAANNLSDVANAATARANLGLTIGTHVQAQDTELTALASVTSAADKLPYFTGLGTAAVATFTTFIRTLMDDTDAATARATLGATIPAQIDIFAADDTWTKPAGAKIVTVFNIGGGGGGGSGRKGASGSVRGGGGGGGGGAFTWQTFQASLLGSTEAVTVGVGGPGGPSQTTNSTNGTIGTAGERTTFGSWLSAEGGAPGNAGTDSDGGAGGAATTGMEIPAGGGKGGGLAVAVEGGTSHFRAAAGGGGGQGVTAANVVVAAAAGGSAGGFSLPTALAGGAATGAVGTSATAGLAQGGGGGGGGTSGTAGGAGGTYGGGGGGGGRAANDVNNSGAGGVGGNGLCLVITCF